MKQKQESFINGRRNGKVTLDYRRRSWRRDPLLLLRFASPLSRRLQSKSSEQKPEPTRGNPSPGNREREKGWRVWRLEREREVGGENLFYFARGFFLRGRVYMCGWVRGWIRAAELAESGRWGPPAGQPSAGRQAHRPVRSPPLNCPCRRDPWVAGPACKRGKVGWRRGQITQLPLAFFFRSRFSLFLKKNTQLTKFILLLFTNTQY